MPATLRRARKPGAVRRLPAATLTDLERDLLQYIVDHADLLDVVTAGRGGGAQRVRFNDRPGVYSEGATSAQPTLWLLVPVTADVLDRLANVGADLEDSEDGGDAERSAVRPETMSRMELDDPVDLGRAVRLVAPAGRPMPV